jgi:hypothetical protein
VMWGRPMARMSFGDGFLEAFVLAEVDAEEVGEEGGNWAFLAPDGEEEAVASEDIGVLPAPGLSLCPLLCRGGSSCQSRLRPCAGSAGCRLRCVGRACRRLRAANDRTRRRTPSPRSRKARRSVHSRSSLAWLRKRVEVENPEMASLGGRAKNLRGVT